MDYFWKISFSRSLVNFRQKMFTVLVSLIGNYPTSAQIAVEILKQNILSVLNAATKCTLCGSFNNVEAIVKPFD